MNFANFRLRNRLLLGYVVPATLFTLLSTVVSLNFVNVITIFDQTSKLQDFKLETNQLFYKLVLMSSDLRSYRMSGNNNYYLEKYQREKNDFHQDARQGEKMLKTVSQEQQEIFKGMIELEKKYEVLVDKFIYAQTIKYPDYVREASLGLTQKIFLQFEQLNQRAQDLVLGDITINTNNINSSIDFVKLISVIIPLISLAIAILVGYMITQQITGLILQVRKTGMQITSASMEIAVSGKTLEIMMGDRVTSTNQVTATAKQIATISAQLVKIINEVELTSQETTQSAGDSQAELLQMEGLMQQLANGTTIISQQLAAITQAANNIHNLVATITKVADKTHLLSLNAAIESEQAGEYGTGFAFVAQEICRLADQAALATVDTEKMVKEMEVAVSTAVIDMDNFATQVQQGVGDVNRISEKLGSIIQQVQQFTPSFQQVSYNMEVQAEGAVHISQEMIRLSKASAQTANSLGEVNQGINQLNNVAQSLHQAIAYFESSHPEALKEI